MLLQRLPLEAAALSGEGPIAFARRLAALTGGFVGGDLVRLCQAAQLHAAQRVDAHSTSTGACELAAARATRLAAATIEWVDFGQALRHVPPSQLRGLDVRRGRNALDEERSEVSWASVGGCAARGFERSRAITSVPRGPRQGTNTSLRGSARSSNCRWCRSQSYNRRDAARCRRPRLPRARKPCDGLASGPSEPCLACGQPTRHPGPPRFPVLQQACFCTGRRVAASHSSRASSPPSATRILSPCAHQTWRPSAYEALIRARRLRTLVERARRQRYLGESEATVRALFARARAAAPCVLFFDEARTRKNVCSALFDGMALLHAQIDAIAARRELSDDGGGGSTVGKRILLTLLNEARTAQNSLSVGCLLSKNHAPFYTAGWC